MNNYWAIKVLDWVDKCKFMVYVEGSFYYLLKNMTDVTIAYGDGVGPEIMEATLLILKEAAAKINPHVIEVGESVYKRGYVNGISDDDWGIIRSNPVFLKAPITTPQGGGYRSLNVAIRKTLGLYQNIRPVRSYYPFVKTHFAGINSVMFRENEEDLYSGIEHQHSENCFIATKLLTKTGTEKIARAAFEYAVKAGRKKVTCVTKDNIMKITDGMFHKTCAEIAADYPKIEFDHAIVDIGAAHIATRPDQFDVIVTLNLYGDILSDIMADVAGSVGMGGSGNIGDKYAMFEAIHGSAPRLAGQNKANPSGLINGAIMMLAHIGQGSVASAIENSLLYTVENGFGTADLYKEGRTKQVLTTAEFASKIASNLGEKPREFDFAKYADFEFKSKVQYSTEYSFYTPKSVKTLSGADFYVHVNSSTQELVDKIADDADLSVKGLTVHSSSKKTHIDVQSDFWKIRKKGLKSISEITDYIAKLSSFCEVSRFDSLYDFDGKAGHSAD